MRAASETPNRKPPQGGSGTAPRGPYYHRREKTCGDVTITDEVGFATREELERFLVSIGFFYIARPEARP
jgi:hypothetical protein